MHRFQLQRQSSDVRIEGIIKAIIAQAGRVLNGQNVQPADTTRRLLAGMFDHAFNADFRIAQQTCHAYFTGSVATQRANGNTTLAYLHQTAM